MGKNRLILASECDTQCHLKEHSIHKAQGGLDPIATRGPGGVIVILALCKFHYIYQSKLLLCIQCF